MTFAQSRPLEGTLPPGALDGFRVLDLADESGVFAGRYLADLGADVIRIEPPGGDRVRSRKPHLKGVEGPEYSLYHHHFNLNKRGITLNLRNADGACLLKRLVREADAIIETCAPGEMESMGLGFQDLKAIRPALLYTTITPFGQTGPMSAYRGNDLIGVAASGFLTLNGLPGDAPLQPGGEQAYHLASLAAVSGMLVALRGLESRSDGLGHRIDISIQEVASMVTLQTANASAYAWHRTIPRRRGLDVPGGQNLFQCSDGLWVRFVVHPPHWDKFVVWLQENGVESVVSRPEWRDQGYRVEHPQPIVEAMTALASRLTRDVAFHAGQAHRVLAMPVNTIADLVEDEQLSARSYFIEYEQPSLGRSLRDSGFVPRMSATPPRFRRAAPCLGQHNAEVYCGLLGVTSDELGRLAEAGVI